MRITAAAVLLVAGAMARADCISTTRPVSTPGVFPNHIAGPIAWSGSVLGVAKTDFDAVTSAIHFATYDINFTQLADDRKLVDASFNGAAALLWTGSEFGLFYQNQGRQLVLQRLDATGNAIGAAIPIINHSWSPDDEFDVVWAPARSGYAVAHSVTQGADRGLWVTIVSATGTIVADTNIAGFISPPSNPRVVALPDGTVGVVWTRSAEAVRLMFVSLVIPGNPAQKNVAVSDRAISSLRVASNDTSILLIYSAGTTTGTELRATMLDRAGNVVTSDVRFLTGRGIDITPSSLVWNPALGEWALVYIDAQLGLFAFPGDTRLRRFASLDAPPSDTIFSPNPLQSQMTAPFPIVFANGGYIGSIRRVLSRAEGSESYLIKTCPFAVSASADRPFSPPASAITFTATGSGGTLAYTFEWDFGDLSRATGAVVQHVFLRPGTYTITLTGTDAAGAKAIAKLTVQVAAPRRRAVK